MFDIHATVHVNLSEPNEIKSIPPYVHNHGILSGEEIQQLLQKTKVRNIIIKDINRFHVGHIEYIRWLDLGHFYLCGSLVSH